jgi:hypothetical protein
MSAASSRWKGLEKSWSKLLNRFKVPATRISRAANYNVSDYDVRIEGAEWLKSDTKYSTQSFKTSRLLDIIEDKYCKEPGDQPILICKGYKEHGMKVTLKGAFAAMLLAYWLGTGTKEELMKIYNKAKPDEEIED